MGGPGHASVHDYCNDQNGQHFAITTKVHFISTYMNRLFLCHFPRLLLLLLLQLPYFFHSSPAQPEFGYAAFVMRDEENSNRCCAAHIDHDHKCISFVLSLFGRTNGAISFIPMKAILAIFTTTQNWSEIEMTSASWTISTFRKWNTYLWLLPHHSASVAQ